MDIWKQLIIGTRTCQFCRIQSIKKGQACTHKKSGNMACCAAAVEVMFVCYH